MLSQKDRETLRNFFGNLAPNCPNEASFCLRRAENGQTGITDLPAEVFLALQNFLTQDMGHKISPKQRDRAQGQKARKKRTGSRRG